MLKIDRKFITTGTLKEMERTSLLEALEDKGGIRHVCASFRDTYRLNDYLESRGAGGIPIVTGDVLEDLVHVLYSMNTNGSERDTLWRYLARYYNLCEGEHMNPGLTQSLTDYFNDEYNTMSRFVGEILVHTYKTEGPYYLVECLAPFRESVDSEHFKNALIDKGMGEVLIYIFHDPEMMNKEALIAARDPRRLWWLVHNRCKKPWYSEYIDIHIVTDLCCLTLIKCFELSSSSEEFESRFKELLEAYEQAVTSGVWSDAEPLYTLMFNIEQCMEEAAFIGLESYPLHYYRALMFALKVYGVGIEELIEYRPEWEQLFERLLENGDDV